MLGVVTPGGFIHWNRMRYCPADRSGHYRGSGAGALHRETDFRPTMDPVIDEPDERVLSTDQLTLMRLVLLQAKYFPLLLSRTF